MQDLINKILEFLGIKTNELPNNQQDTTSSGTEIPIISAADASKSSFEGNYSSPQLILEVIPAMAEQIK